MKEETIIRISVRSLVEFILREGDIDNRVSGSMEKDAMLLGGKIHRKIQSRMGTNYTAASATGGMGRPLRDVYPASALRSLSRHFE